MKLAGWWVPTGLIAIILSSNPLWAQAPPKPTFAMQITAQARLADGSPAPQGSLCEMDYQNGQLVDQGQTDSLA
jgi:hypothetical protein